LGRYKTTLITVTGEWNFAMLQQVLPQNILQKLHAIVTPQQTMVAMCWCGRGNVWDILQLKQLISYLRETTMLQLMLFGRKCGRWR
ncbi:hypothetical protein A2U01_0075350, partial [Trifolium medium]|nr:hypothetical protein [Trifolium medium]